MHRLPLYHCHHLRLLLESTNPARKKRKYACCVTQQSKTILEFRDTMTNHPIYLSQNQIYEVQTIQYMPLLYSTRVFSKRSWLSTTAQPNAGPPFFFPNGPPAPGQFSAVPCNHRKFRSMQKERTTEQQSEKSLSPNTEIKKPTAVGWPIVRYLSRRLGSI